MTRSRDWREGETFVASNGQLFVILAVEPEISEEAAEHFHGAWTVQPVAEPLIVCTHAQTPEAILATKQLGAEDLERCRVLGEALAAGLALGVF